MTMTLYYGPAACSLVPHIALREIGADFDLVRVSVRSHKTESGEDFYDINPKGYVPVLKLENGELLTEVPAIAQYIADQKPETGLAPKAGSFERVRLQEWLAFIGTEVHKSFSPLFNPSSSDEIKEAQKKQIARRFDYLEKVLSDGRSYLMGDTCTIADIYLFAVVSWCNYIDIDIAPWPHLKAFVARITERPHTQAALKAEGLLKG